MTHVPLSLSVSDRTRVLIEVEPPPPGIGDEDGDDLERWTTGPREALEGELSEIALKITEIAECFEERFNAVPQREAGFALDGAEIELAFQLKGGADLFLVKGEAQAHIKVRLNWARG